MQQLKKGNEGLLVIYVQFALKRAGESTGALDGLFGERTENAVKSFQNRNDLKTDGIVGDKTWTALFPYLSGYTILRVQQGDTLYRIAQTYQTSVEAITRANPTVEPENLQIGSVLTVPLPLDAVPWEIPYSSLLTELVLDGLAVRYPKLHLNTFGRSGMGRSLLAASFGEGDIAVGINASHHANEWITTPLVLRMLETYLDAQASGRTIYGQDAAALYRRTRLILVPLVNPDGVDLVNGLIPANNPFFQTAMGYAGTYPAIPFPSGWKSNIRGVDLNLGYPAGWERAKAIKFAQGYNRPGPRDYVGSSPLAESENRAMVSLTEQNGFRLTVSYHTQGAEIYWRYNDLIPENAYRIADAFAAVSGYTVADPAANSSFAGYKDWFIDTFRLPGFTIEAGRGTNPLPIDDLPSLYRENLGIFVNSLALAAKA